MVNISGGRLFDAIARCRGETRGAGRGNVSRRAPGHADITIFRSLGMAVEDVMAAIWRNGRAAGKGLGKRSFELCKSGLKFGVCLTRADFRLLLQTLRISQLLFPISRIIRRD